MKLRKIDFGHVLGAAGVQGFSGGTGKEEEYRYRRYSPIKPNFKGMTFVSKTSTLPPNRGNTPMCKDGITLKELFPKCIWVDFRGKKIMNAMALPGPGFEALLEMNKWQLRTEPFGISIMSIGKTPEERLEETRGFTALLAKHIRNFQAPFFIQKNYTCPNVGLDLSCLVDEVWADLDILAELGISVMPKFNVLTPVKIVKAVTEHKACDAICCSNTIHWNDLHKVGIDRKKLFGTDISPLAKFGGGGLSGAPLLPLVVDWLKTATMAIRKPINAGGGILSAKDVDSVYCAGVSSIFVGSVATLHPRRVQEIIKRAKELFRKETT